MRQTRAFAVGLLLVIAPSTAAVTSAAAHPVGQPVPDAAHYLTRISAVTPSIAGLTASVDPRGDWLEVSNTTTHTLTVLGYAHEPYLRISPAGVAENTASPTLVLNQSLFGDLTQLGDATRPPSWHPTSTEHTVRWHDHRIHWMSAERPPAVKAHPDVGRLIGPWRVHMTLDRTPVDVTGTLSWLPVKKRSTVASTLLLTIDCAVLVVAVAIGAWIARRRRTGNGPGSDRDRARTTATDAGPPSTVAARGPSGSPDDRTQSARH